MMSPGKSWVDGFESGWSNDGFLFVLGATTPATFSGDVYAVALESEGFEIGWATDQALLSELAPTVAADFATGGGPVAAFEAFEAGWGVVTFATTLPSSEALPAETFNSGWDNDGYTFLLASSATASFDGASPEPVEDFEEVSLIRQFSALPATNKLVIADHALSNGDAVHVYSEGRLPAGLNATAIYWVANKTDDDFELDAVAPGVGPAIVDLGDTGFGVHHLVRDRTLFWTEYLDA